MASVVKGSHTSQPERFCKYIHRYCNQTRLDGYDYCIRHILEDKSAPFKQCMYVNQPNKKRCTNAAPKSEKNERRDNVLCPFHAKRAQLKVKIAPPKKKLIEGPAALLKSLEHYCKHPAHDSSYNRESAIHEKTEITSCIGGSLLDLHQLESTITDAESIEEKAFIEGVDDDFCWVEKYEDYLANAGVYTHKEILTIAKEKILRLQQLYCEELKVIYRQLKENQRMCLAELKNPTQSRPSCSETTQQTSEENDSALLKPLSHYHRHSGAERVMRHRMKMERLNAGKPLPEIQMCTYEKTGKPCLREALVLTKFCKRHILFDPKQLLFKPCGFGQKEKCKRPVLACEENASCDLHLHLQLKSKLGKPSQPVSCPELPAKVFQVEPEPFQSMDDIASLGLDVIAPGSLFGLDQYGEPGESTDTVLSEDQADLMQIQPISLNPPSDILSDSRKSESE